MRSARLRRREASHRHDQRRGQPLPAGLGRRLPDPDLRCGVAEAAAHKHPTRTLTRPPAAAGTTEAAVQENHSFLRVCMCVCVVWKDESVKGTSPKGDMSS